MLQVPLNLLRGFLIGMAELVPGVSGGTVALVTGVYEHLIDSASHVLAALRRLLTGPDRGVGFREELRRTDWGLVLPVFLGMGTAVLTMAGVMEGFVSDAPEHARALFLGLVAASILVPLRMLPARNGSRLWVDLVVFGVAAAVAFVLIGLAGGGDVEDPPLLLVAAVAAVAICALVVPGVSGSFFLLAVGMYSVTLTAVDERDLVYIAVFGLGAAVGLASFVQVLRWALRLHRRVTLLAMAGLMLGSLRALWPWQAGGDDHTAGHAVAPYEPLLGPLGLVVLGVAVVLVLILVEDRVAVGAVQQVEGLDALDPADPVDPAGGTAGPGR